MNQDPNHIESDPAGDPSGELLAIDQAMLLALSHRPRGGAPLTVEQEALLDSWVAGKLAASEADQAAALIKRNGFASERVLERRLIAAANDGPEVPAALASRVLASRPKERVAHAEKSPGQSFSIWSMLSSWQWSGLGAAVAATLVVAVIGLRMWQEPQTRAMQFAMVTIDDRSAFGPSRVRSLQPQMTQDGFDDINVPADLIRRTVADAGGRGLVEPSEWSPFLPASKSGGQTHILIDATVADRLSGDWRSRNALPVRIYDLDDARWAAIRAQVRNIPAGRRVLLVTQR